jgi:NAD(P)-dependent dehydrogenase (short-subunit alcohol dehydrogenase family)
MNRNRPVQSNAVDFMAQDNRMKNESEQIKPATDRASSVTGGGESRGLGPAGGGGTSMNRLENKVGLITGGASGIGLGITRRFAREGADVCIGDFNFDGAKAAAEEIAGIGRRSWAVKVDVRSPADLDKMVSSTIDHFGRIDILVNSAGVDPMRPMLEITEDDWDLVMDVNLKGLYFVTQRVLPHMIKQGKGKVINIASTFAFIAGHTTATTRGRACGASAYDASKGGVVSLTRALAVEFAPQGINFNAIAPGFTNTPLTKSLRDDQKLLQGFVEQIPAGRIAEPEDIAATAVFLASDDSDFVTGQTLVVDGGQTSW